VRDAWLARLRSWLPAPPAEVADLGCGTGTLSVLLAGAGYPVRGVDLSAQMIQAARAKATAAGVDVAFRQGDAADPPVAAFPWVGGVNDKAPAMPSRTRPRLPPLPFLRSENQMMPRVWLWEPAEPCPVRIARSRHEPAAASTGSRWMSWSPTSTDTSPRLAMAAMGPVAVVRDRGPTWAGGRARRRRRPW
jgi:SAM-dependent methyltransferase